MEDPFCVSGNIHTDRMMDVVSYNVSSNPPPSITVYIIISLTSSVIDHSMAKKLTTLLIRRGL